MASGEQYVDKLSEEFNRKRGLFDDDLAFIREVKSQETPASGMDPDTELQTLHKRFSNWKKEFKVSQSLILTSHMLICVNLAGIAKSAAATSRWTGAVFHAGCRHDVYASLLASTRCYSWYRHFPSITRWLSTRFASCCYCRLDC